MNAIIWIVIYLFSIPLIFARIILKLVVTIFYLLTYGWIGMLSGDLTADELHGFLSELWEGTLTIKR